MVVYDANLYGDPGDVILAPSSGWLFRYRSKKRVGESPRFPSLSLPPSSYYPILSILSVHCARSGRISILGLIRQRGWQYRVRTSNLVAPSPTLRIKFQVINAHFMIRGRVKLKSKKETAPHG